METRGTLKHWMTRGNTFWVLKRAENRHPKEIEDKLLCAMMKRFPTITNLFQTTEGHLIVGAKNTGVYPLRDFYEICAIGMRL